MLNIEDVPFAAAAAGFGVAAAAGFGVAAAAGFGVAAGFGAAGAFLLKNEKNPFEAGAAGFGVAGFGVAGPFLLNNEKNPFEAGAAGFGAAGFAAAGSFFLNNEENPFETAAFAEVSLELIAEPALPAAAFAEVSPELIAEPALPAAAFAEVSPELIAEPALPSIVFPDDFDEFLRVLEVAFFENLLDTVTAVLSCFFTVDLGRVPIAFIASSLDIFLLLDNFVQVLMALHLVDEKDLLPLLSIKYNPLSLAIILSSLTVVLILPKIYQLPLY
jgi:hypothetical protein